MVNIIVAVGNYVSGKGFPIGAKGGMPWHNKADLKWFKDMTTGHPVIMGRKTFDSLPKGALPNRRNIVLSRNKRLTFPGAERFSSLQEALENCNDDEQVFIIGGASVYREALPLADRLCITHIEATPDEADVFFPKIDYNEWEEKIREPHPIDERHTVPYIFVDYERKEQKERAES